MTHKITLDPNKDLKQLVKNGKYDCKYVNLDYVLPPLEKTKTVEIELVKLNKYCSNNQVVVDAMDKQGYRMATFREVLTLCSKNKELQNDRDIASVDKDFYIACYRFDDVRCVSVDRGGGDWVDCWWFAGVHKSLDTISLSASKSSDPLILEHERELPPAIGVSAWRSYGRKYKYWSFFAKQIRQEIAEELEKFTDQEAMDKFIKKLKI